MRATAYTHIAQNQRGVALITAVLVTALAATAAVAMITRQQLDIRRTASVIDREQAYQYALGVEVWAQQILARDKRDNSVDNLDEDWAKVLPPIAVDGGAVTGRLEDLQGRFNLNNLVNAEGKRSEEDVKRFERLLETLELNKELALVVLDWIDRDIEPSYPGAEDPEYLGGDPPYRTANAPFASVSELRLVKGISREDYARLEPHVAALPFRTAVNVNTASAPVIRAAIQSITLEDAQALVEARKGSPFDKFEAFEQHSVLAGRGISPSEKEALSVSSSCFMLYASTQFGRGRVDLASMLRRDEGGAVRVVARSQGAVL